MANLDNRPTGYGATVNRGAVGAIDEGLRAFMLRVYNYMAIGLGITGVAAYGVYSAGGDHRSGAGGRTARQRRHADLVRRDALRQPADVGDHPGAARAGLLPELPHQPHERRQPRRPRSAIYAALLGVSLSSIFLVYTMASITQVFFITAATFGTMSLWGYTTQRDLTSLGSFMMMGLIGIIIASVVNIFLASSALGFAISIIGVLVFTGLTAYDTQKIKEMYTVNDDGTIAGRKAIMGALSLYLDFLNLFLMLLRLFGDRR